jgi:hypothetical protein
MQTIQEQRKAIKAKRKASRKYIAELQEIIQATIKLHSPSFKDYTYSGSCVTASIKYRYDFMSQEFQKVQQNIINAQNQLFELRNAQDASIQLYARINYLPYGRESSRYIRLIISI